MPEALPEELTYAQELAARSEKPKFRSSRSAIGHTLVMRGDLQLDAHSRLFHRHVRRHLLGFGHVHINMALDQHAHLNNLAVSESEKNQLRQKFGAVSFEPGQATQAHGKVLVANAADLENMKNENQAGKQFTAKESEDTLKNMNGGAYLSAKVDVPAGKLTAPKSIMSHLEIDHFAGAIEWPQDECVEKVANFEHPIPLRLHLDQQLEQGAAAAPEEGAAAPNQKGSQFKSERRQEGTHKVSAHRTKKVVQSTQTKDCDVEPWEEKSEAAGIKEGTWSTGTWSPGSAKQCKDMKEQVDQLYSDFSSFAKGDESVLGEVNQAVGSVLSGLKCVEELSTGLSGLLSAMKIINVVLAPMQMLPYVGSVIKILRKALGIVLKTVGRGVKKIAKFGEKITKKTKIKTALCKISKDTGTVAAALVKTTRPLNTVAKTALYVDTLCNDQVKALTEGCGAAATVLTKFNAETAKLRESADKAHTELRNIGAVFDKVKEFTENSMYQAFDRFVKKLDPFLKPIKEALDKVISITIPWPTMKSKRVCISIAYPCGIDWCSSSHWWGTIHYPCGVKWCHKSGCTTIRYPWIKMKTFSFSINSLINGVMSLAEIIMAPLNLLIEGAMKALGLDKYLNGLTLPGLPKIPSFDVDLDLDKYAEAVFAPLKQDIPTLKIDIPELPVDVLKGTTCAVGSTTCSGLFACEAEIECSGFDDEFAKFFPKEYNWEGTKGPVTATADASITASLTPAIQLGASWKEGFEGSFTLPLELQASFALDIAGEIKHPETKHNIGAGKTHTQVLPLGKGLIIQFSFALQPWTKRSLDISAKFHASVDITCSTSLTLNYEKRRKNQKDKKPKKEPFTHTKPKCTHEVSITSEGEASATLELGVDIDVAINDNVGAHVTPRIALALNAGGDGKPTAKASMEVSTSMHMPDLATLGKDTCEKTFNSAEEKFPDFPAKKCVVAIAEQEACSKIEDILKANIPEIPPETTLWEKEWTSDDIAKLNKKPKKPKKKTPAKNKYPQKAQKAQKAVVKKG